MSAPKFWRLAAAAAAAGLTGGCEPNGPKADQHVGDNALHLDWSQFPESSTLLLAQLPGVIAAPRSEAIRAPAAGRLHLLPAATAAGALPAGTTWARIQPEAAQLDEQALARAERELNDRRETYRREELPAALIRLDAEIAAAKEEAALAQFAERSPGLFQGDAAPLDPRLRPRASSGQANAQVQLLERRRRGMAANDPAFEPADLQAAASGLKRAQAARVDGLDRMNLIIPFQGTLRLARSAEAAERRVEAGEVLAEIEDTRFLEISLRATLPLLHAVEASTLTCTLAIPGGAEAIGDFSSWGFEPGAAGNEPVMRFRLRPSTSAASDERLLGVALPVLIFTHLKRPARIVPKLLLAEADPDGKLEAGWRQGVVRLFPGCRFVAEGRAAVAVLPP